MMDAKQPNGVGGISELTEAYIRLYSHVHRNYIVADVYARYKSLCEKVFHGIILSLQTPIDGVTQISEFFITEAVLHIPPANLKEILENINHLPTSAECQVQMVNKLYNFLTSYYKQTLFGDPDFRPEIVEQLNNYRYKAKHNQFFSNFFSILSRMEISEQDLNKIKQPLRHFLRIEEELFWFDLAELKHFLAAKSQMFTSLELTDLLHIFIERDKPNINKYHKLIDDIPNIINKQNPGYLLSNKLLVATAVLKCHSTDDKRVVYNRVLNLSNICDDVCKKILFDAFEEFLDKQFSGDFYERLIRQTDYSLKRKDYFGRYVAYINSAKDKNTYKFGKHGFTDLVFINFIFLFYKRKINPKRQELKLLTNINDFERWMLAPRQFNYRNFNQNWLYDLQNTSIIKSLKNIKPLNDFVKIELDKKFDVRLADIYSTMTQTTDFKN
jgi:hypothetical protein